MNNPSQVFHERFRMLRARAQLSQGQVAESLGVSQNAVGTWERGESQPQVEHIHAMCTLFKVSADWLVGISNHETGLPIGMFLVDMDGAEDPREMETWATQIPQRPALMSYDEVRKIYSEGVKHVKRKGKR